MKSFKTICFATAAALALTAAIGAAGASATTLAVGGTAKNSAIEIIGSLTAGSSMIYKDEFGTTTDTCTKSEFKEKTEGTFTGEKVTGKASSLSYENCSHTTKVDANGGTWWVWIPFTNNATVFSFGTEVTVQSTFFGATALCKTGAGTHIGTLTGVFFGRSRMHYNAKINCGILGNTSVTGEYTITSPEGLSATS